MSSATLNRESFRSLFENYYDLICNYLNVLTGDWDLSQEVAQKTFVKVWERRQEISFTSSPKSYLYQAARNTLIDHYRAHKTAHANVEQYSDLQNNVTELEVGEKDRLDVMHKISWAVDQLKPKTREIFLLSKQEGLTYDEIAKYLKISKRTVEYNMKNALLQLKDLLKDKLY